MGSYSSGPVWLVLHLCAQVLPGQHSVQSISSYVDVFSPSSLVFLSLLYYTAGEDYNVFIHSLVEKYSSCFQLFLSQAVLWRTCP